MKTGLFFGSFNPIHNAHIALAKHLQTKGLDEIWFVVSPQNPLKKSADLLSDELRLHLAKMALQNEDKLHVSDVEFSLPKPSYTIETLRFLQSQHPEHQFVLLIGADNVALFDRWKNYDEILRDFEVWAYPRQGFPSESAQFPQIKFVDAPLFNLSATEIRKRVQAGETIENLVPQNVADFIREKLLYKK